MELSDDLEELGKVDYDNVETSPELVSRLSEILRKGQKYADAYTTVLMIKVENKHIENEKVIRHAIWIEPELEKEILEASALVLT